MTDKDKTILDYHRGGKISLGMPRRLDTVEDLCLAYTPGVAVAVKAIAAEPPTAFDYTAKGGLVAVVSDGTAILGLGDLGPAASIPVMEGKAVLFKSFANVNAWPVVLDHCREGGASTGPTDPQRVIDAVMAIAPMYGGINLEDIAAPACFEIEDRLADMLDIPVFHDDQWGTAVIVLAATTNYARLCGKPMETLKVVINGAGAAGTRIREMLMVGGVKHVVMCDSKGVIYKGRPINKARHDAVAADTPLRTLDPMDVQVTGPAGPVSVGGTTSTTLTLGNTDYVGVAAFTAPPRCATTLRPRRWGCTQRARAGRTRRHVHQGVRHSGRLASGLGARRCGANSSTLTSGHRADSSTGASSTCQPGNSAPPISRSAMVMACAAANKGSSCTACPGTENHRMRRCTMIAL